jgi:hypothetical protein
MFMDAWRESFPDIVSCVRGNFALSEVRIVGASAWNPTTMAINATTTMVVLAARSAITAIMALPFVQ